MQAYYPTIDAMWPEHGSQDYWETLLETTTKYNHYPRDFVLYSKLKETIEPTDQSIMKNVNRSYNSSYNHDMVLLFESIRIHMISRLSA
jgi:hypothetical protein